jgi:hypothetical protein
MEPLPVTIVTNITHPVHQNGIARLVPRPLWMKIAYFKLLGAVTLGESRA